MNPLFSIIIPVFNAEKFIKDCIDSVLAQTSDDYELIIVDDGSTDSSGKVCDDYAAINKNVFVIHKQNEGTASLARNAGINVSNGQYLVFVDSDDYLSKDFLERFKCIIKRHNPDVVCCNYTEVFESGFREALMDYRPGLYSRKDIVNLLFPSLILSRDGKSFPSQLWAKAFKKDLYKKYMFIDKRIVVGEDLASSKPVISASSTVYILNSCLYFYRKNLSSITRSKRVFEWEGPLLRMEHLLSKMDNREYSFEEQIYRDTMVGLFTVTISRFNQKNDNKMIKSDIKTNLSKQCVSDIIKKASFSKLKFIVIRMLLKHRMVFFLKLYKKAACR